MEPNPYIGLFLLKNSFEKKEYNTYANSKCTVKVVDDYYQIDFYDSELGEGSMYTDSLSMYHLIGILTWYDLMDRNYKK